MGTVNLYMHCSIYPLFGSHSHKGFLTLPKNSRRPFLGAWRFAQTRKYMIFHFLTVFSSFFNVCTNVCFKLKNLFATPKYNLFSINTTFKLREIINELKKNN